MEGLARLQRPGLAGLEELSRSEDAENRAWVASALLGIGGESEAEVLKRLETDDGRYEWFDGCCQRHQTVAGFIEAYRKARPPRAKDAPNAEGGVAMRVEAVVESVFIWYGGPALSGSELIGSLRRAGSPPAWKAVTEDAWWDAGRAVWNLWWTEFHGKPDEQATWEEWDRRSREPGK